MQKQIGSILLVAGTCIGSGMIALPLVLAPLGLVYSICLMIVIWSIMCFTSFINLELNLQAGQGLPLGPLSRKFSGRNAEFIGSLSLKLLTYSLLAAYLYGGTSIMQKLLTSLFMQEYSFSIIATIYTTLISIILLLPIKFIDNVNKTLFTGLMASIGVFIGQLFTLIEWNHLPLWPLTDLSITPWRLALPVVFTSFGFQVIFHTLTNYCQKDVIMLRRAFLWGSLIPACIYTMWSTSILSIIFHNKPAFYAKMVSRTIEVGDLIKELTNIAQWQEAQLIIWLITFFVIVTSIIGVGIGLTDSLRESLSLRIPHSRQRDFISILLAIIPSYLVAIFVQNAFISVLGFAGMILTIIAILLPVYLLCQLRVEEYSFPIIKNHALVFGSVIAGIIIMIAEMINIFSK